MFNDDLNLKNIEQGEEQYEMQVDYEEWLREEAEQFKRDLDGGLYEEQGLTDEQVWALKDAEEAGF